MLLEAEVFSPPHESSAPSAPKIVLGPLLRYVSANSATVWVETDKQCAVSVNSSTTSTFSCSGRHYALVIIDDLQPGSVTPYTVELDGEQVWPEASSTLPHPVIRTLENDKPVIIKFGSCRMAAPHTTPYTLLPDQDAHGSGVDMLRALGLSMLTQTPEQWPDLMVFLGDQVYADESSPTTARRIEQRALTSGRNGLPEGVVANFEEYTWLYHESWLPEIERWVLSVVPSAMIFDDHDMIDDWNISIDWVRRIRREPWWGEHVVGGLMSYLIYQHLGNMSPERLRDEGMLAHMVGLGDATEYLREWALESETFTPVPGGYQFSYDRHLGATHVVVIDTRNGRVLEPLHREMVDTTEWDWVRDRVLEPAEHVVLAMSLPLFAPGGLHGLQQWNEALCDGMKGKMAARWSSALRVAFDLEHWAAFDRTFRRFERLLIECSTPPEGGTAPASITVCAGDIHFAFLTEVKMPQGCTSTVRQAVCSPLRNNLKRRDQRVMAVAMSTFGRKLGNLLMKHAKRDASALVWGVPDLPIFGNNIGTLTVKGHHLQIVIETGHRLEDGSISMRTEVDVSSTTFELSINGA